MQEIVDKERAIRAVVRQAVEAYASAFSDRHLSEVDDEEGTINMKRHNVFISALGADIQYYSALAHSLDSSLGNLLEKMAINVASLNYEVSQHVEGLIYQEQTDYIAELLENYKNTKGVNHKKPTLDDYVGISKKNHTTKHSKCYESDFYLKDPETGIHYIIGFKNGGDFDEIKARSKKEALLEQYCILANSKGSEGNIRLCSAAGFNRDEEAMPGVQGRACQFFADEEMLECRQLWNLACKSNNGYEIALDEFTRNIHVLQEVFV